MIEIWKDLPGYEGLYKISNLGRVYSVYKKSYKETYYDKNGYVMIGLCKEGKHKNLRLHRLVAEAFIPNANNLPCINHKDEDKTNNRASNLEWCTPAYNNTYGSRIERAANSNRNRKNKKYS